MPKAKFYAVKTGKNPGIYTNWCVPSRYYVLLNLTPSRPDCKAQVEGASGATYKSFGTREEAQSWMTGSAAPASASTSAANGSSDSKGKKRKMSPDIADESGWEVVYSDGASKGNGQAGAVAGVGVWWGRDDPRCVVLFIPMAPVLRQSRNIAERCPGVQTNNRAELIVRYKTYRMSLSTYAVP
jgi:ribonuclease HI